MVTSRPEQIRILYPLYDLNSGALTNWLMGVLRRLDRQRFQVDFLVHNLEPGYFDDEARAMGARIFPCPHPSRLWTYLPNFKRILQKYGPYDVVHSSLGNCAFHMLLARKVKVPLRISHIHADFIRWAKGSSSKTNPLKILFYQSISPYWICKHSTLILTITKEAAKATLGKKFSSVKNWDILPCGIELDSFSNTIEKINVRRELGIPESAFVIGHVGRFSRQKNQIFVVKIAAELNRFEPNIRVLLIGDGPLRAETEAAVMQAGLSDKVIFTGLRTDVPQLMLAAMDVFVFPVLFEDLGMVIIEAQAAGLPCIISDAIVEEAVIVKPLVYRLSLNDSASTWAKAIFRVRGMKSDSTKTEALITLNKSHFNIDNNVAELQNIYSLCCRC